MSDKTPPDNVRSISLVASNSQIKGPVAEPGAAVKHLKSMIEAIESGAMPEPEFGVTMMGFTDPNEAPIQMEFGTKEVHPYMIVGLIAEAKILTLSPAFDADEG